MILRHEIKETITQFRAVVFQITDMTDEDRVIIAKYGHPAIKFDPKGDFVNDWIWSGNAIYVGFDTPDAATANIRDVQAQLRDAMRKLRERYKREGGGGTAGKVEV